MRRVWLLVMLVAMVVGCAMRPVGAAEGVLQDPQAAVTSVKGAVDATMPGVEQLYDFRSGEWYTGTSAALWTFSAQHTPVATLRGGYAVDYKIYSSLQADLSALTRTFVLPVLPNRLEVLGRSGALDSVWTAIGKYGLVGGFLGYDFDRQETGNQDAGGLMVGVSLGAKFTF